MARPIPHNITTRPDQAERLEHFDRIPQEHTAAILAGLEVLQLLHDQGVLEVLRGALSAGDKISEQLTAAGNTKESVRALRNLAIMGKMLSSVDPAVMQRIAAAVEETVGPNAPPQHEVPRLFSLFGYLQHKYLRRSLFLVIRFFAALGRQLTFQTS